MNLYTIALFVHVVGVIAVFVSIGTWVFGYAGLWRARRVEQVREIARLMVWSGYIAVGGLPLLGAAGGYMALAVWGWRTGWIDVATVSFLLAGIGGTLAIDPRVRSLAARTRDLPAGDLSEKLALASRDPVVGSGLLIYLSVLLGIVFLMTTKPAFGLSVIVVALALAVGVAVSVPLWRAARRPAMPVPPAAER